MASFFLFDFSNAKNLINFIEWKTPSYETTADPDFDSLKRLGRAYFLLEQKNWFTQNLNLKKI